MEEIGFIGPCNMGSGMSTNVRSNRQPETKEEGLYVNNDLDQTPSWARK